jgi:hypothetical protein
LYDFDSKSFSKIESASNKIRCGAKLVCVDELELTGEGVEQFNVLQIATSLAFGFVDLADFFLQHFIGQTLLSMLLPENEVPAGTLEISASRKNNDVSHLFISFNVFQAFAYVNKCLQPE